MTIERCGIFRLPSRQHPHPHLLGQRPGQRLRSAGPLKGYQAQLFEGGIRSSLVARAPALMRRTVPETSNKSSVFWAMELVLSLLDLAGVSAKVPRRESRHCAGRWKLLFDYGQKPRLYGLTRDPGEQTDLAGRHPEVVRRLIKAVLKWNAGPPIDAGDPLFSTNK